MLLAVCSVTAFSQEQDNKWSARINFDPISTGFTKNSNSFAVGLTFYRNIANNVDFGMGFKLQENWKFNGAPAIPVFVSAHYDKQSRTTSPILDFETGIGLLPSDFGHSSYFLNPMVGVRINNLGISVGYQGSVAFGYDQASWGSGMNIRLSYYLSNQRGQNEYSRFIEYLRTTSLLVSLGYEIASADKKYFEENMSTAAINLAWLFPVCENFEMGPSLGVNLAVGDIDFIYLPIALRSRYNFKQATFAKKFYPWLQLDLGGAFRNGGDYKVGSFLARPAVGISMDVRGGKSALDLSVGYSSVGAKTTHEYAGDGKKHYVGNVGIALGYRF